MKWTNQEVKILKQYSTTAKTMSDIHNDLAAFGYDRTYKAVTRKIESMRLNKPFKKMNIVNLPKILILDIETTPIAVWAWSLGKQYVNPMSIMKDKNNKSMDWYVLSWSAKWLYDDKVLSANGMIPPMPYKTIDTLKVARKEFAFSSNKQDYITKFLGLEEKLDTNFQLWLDCMNGDEEALEKMERYNKTDVVGLEEMYLKLRPYIKNHPNIAIMMDENVCSVCGGDSLVETGKFYHTGASKYEIFYCEGCTSPHIRGKSSMLQTNINVRSSS